MPETAEPVSVRERALRFGVVILAAGSSSRMGRPKQLLEIEGRALVARAAEAAVAARPEAVVVVLGAHAERIRPSLAELPVLIVENPEWSEGMASSIRVGLTALDGSSPILDAVLIALCDQPAFSAEVIARIVAAHRASGRGIVAARYGGRNGAPALFARSCFTQLAALEGDRGARELLNEAPDRVESVSLPELAIDLDTLDDYWEFAGQTRCSVPADATTRA